MTTRVLICDDSSFARKQMARALPSNWDIELHFANNGEEALVLLREGKGEILFLDLNMPVMDGYQTLEHIRKEDLPTMPIVVSGDIQTEAIDRVKRLGALEFIKKPVDGETIKTILHSYGITFEEENSIPTFNIDSIEYDLTDSYQELANVAMGRAAELLARLLNIFVMMPIPNVKYLEVKQLESTLANVNSSDDIAAVCQGFIGSGVAGEALLIFNESSYQDIAELMKHEGDIGEAEQLELLMDISSVLCSACLNGIADQLDITFSLSHPMVIGQHIHFDEVLKSSAAKKEKLLAIEMGYTIENKNINCDLILLITDDSLNSLNERVSYLLE